VFALKLNFGARVLSILLLASSCYGNVVGEGSLRYFSVTNSDSLSIIYSYDIASETLVEIASLNYQATAIALRNGHLYILSHQKVDRFDLDTTSLDNIFTKPTDDQASFESFAIGETHLAIADTADKFYSVDIENGEQAQSSWSDDQVYGLVDLHNGTFLYQSNNGGSGHHLHQASLDSLDALPVELPASVLYRARYSLSKERQALIASSGYVYNLDDFTYKAIVDQFQKIACSDSNCLTLIDRSLTLYNQAYVNLGVYELSEIPLEIIVEESSVISIAMDGESLVVTEIDFNNFTGIKTSVLDEPHTPDLDGELFVGGDYLYALEGGSQTKLSRWEAKTGRYLDSCEFSATITSVKYAANSAKIYLGIRGLISGLYSFDNADFCSTLTYLTTAETDITDSLEIGNGSLLVADQKNIYLYSNLNELQQVKTNGLNPTSGTRALGEWSSTNNSLYYILDDELLTLSVDIDLGTLTSTVPLLSSSKVSSQATLSLKPDGSKLASTRGLYFDLDTETISTNYGDLANTIIWAGESFLTERYHFPQDIAIHNLDGTRRGIWTLPLTSKVRVFNYNDEILILHDRSGHGSDVIFSRASVDAKPDSDGDGFNDFEDLCLGIVTTNNLDTDRDLLGNDCDSDDDNDLIPDSVEQALGLNSLLASDAHGDLDEDGFDNLAEFMAGTDALNPSSIPVPITYLKETFETDSAIAIEFDSASWQWTAEGIDSDGAIETLPLTAMTDTRTLSLAGVFDTGIFQLNSLTQFGLTTTVKVDGLTQTWITSASGTSRYYSTAFERGYHTVEIVVAASGTTTAISTKTIKLDTILFEQDSDGDLFSDSIDNCPNTINVNQLDSDGDGIGNSCDLDPFDDDIDGDGLGSPNDNCQDIFNPDQADIDNDKKGDVCDATDSRPVDTDQDGVPDQSDNCDDIVNPEQENFDGDSYGDICDEDIDNDGLTNTFELQFDYLDPYNSSDVYADPDNDGVQTIYELRSNRDPIVTEPNELISLVEYFPLGNIEFNYLLGDGTALTASMRETSFEGEYEIDKAFNEETYRISNGTISLTKATINSEKYTYQNAIVIPPEIRFGMKYDMDVVITQVASLTSNTETFFRRIELVATSTVEVEGEVHPAVVLRYSEPSRNLVYERIYVKGYGDYYWRGTLQNLVYYADADYKRTDSDDGRVPTDYFNDDSGSSSGGGSIPYLFIGLVTLLGFNRRIWRV